MGKKKEREESERALRKNLADGAGRSSEGLGAVGCYPAQEVERGEGRRPDSRCLKCLC